MANKVVEGPAPFRNRQLVTTLRDTTRRMADLLRISQVVQVDSDWHTTKLYYVAPITISGFKFPVEHTFLEMKFEHKAVRDNLVITFLGYETPFFTTNMSLLSRPSESFSLREWYVNQKYYHMIKSFEKKIKKAFKKIEADPLILSYDHPSKD